MTDSLVRTVLFLALLTALIVTTASPTTATQPTVPLKDALGSLNPQDVFRNFYEITQVPRPSGHMDRMREFLVNFGRGLGLETIVDDAGNVLIRRPAAPGLESRPGVILQVHMDMVPQKDEGTAFDFAADPIRAFVSGDYIVADGTTLGADDGIGTAMAMAVLQSTTMRTGPLEALFTVNEETDMSGANGLKPGGLHGSALINLDAELEGTLIIGSAGAATVSAKGSYPRVSAPADTVAYRVAVAGLRGGHSGMDINLGRGHATKLLVRLLRGAAEPFGLRLASLSGGTAPNAIPREASAVVLVPAARAEPFAGYVRQFRGNRPRGAGRDGIRSCRPARVRGAARRRAGAGRAADPPQCLDRNTSGGRANE